MHAALARGPVLEAGRFFLQPPMNFLVRTKVRFREPYRPPQVRWGAVGTIVDREERAAPNSGLDYWGRARFGDFLTPWIEAWQLEQVN
jgi:hypothetical protein